MGSRTRPGSGEKVSLRKGGGALKPPSKVASAEELERMTGINGAAAERAALSGGPTINNPSKNIPAPPSRSGADRMTNAGGSNTVPQSNSTPSASSMMNNGNQDYFSKYMDDRLGRNSMSPDDLKQQESSSPAPYVDPRDAHFAAPDKTQYDDPRDKYFSDSKAKDGSGYRDPRDKYFKPKDLKKAESDTSDKSYKDPRLKHFKYSPEEALKNSRLGKLLKRVGITGMNRKKAGIYGTVATTFFGGALFLAYIQAPIEFYTISQALRGGFTKPVEDAGDDRSSKAILYKLSGQSERGRLEALNTVADQLEKKIEAEKGIRPIYDDDRAGRHAGYEIVDEEKARKSGILDDISNSVNNSEITSARDISGTKPRLGKGVELKPGARIIHFKPGTPARELRAANRVVMKAMNWNGINTAGASRLSIKRSGASLHLLNKIKEKRAANADEKAKIKDAQEKELTDKIDQTVSDGVETPELDGEAKDLNEKVKAETEGKSKLEADIIKKSLAKGAPPLAVISTLCSAKDIGDGAQKAKYKNNVLPMIRLFWAWASFGEQAASGDDISLSALGILKKSTYDKDTKTHILDGRPIQAKLGKKLNGPDVPVEARVKTIAGKADAFVAVDKVLGFGIGGVDLNTGCDGLGVLSRLPGISQLSDLMAGTIDLALRPLGTSTDDLMVGLFSMINGKSVDTKVKGGALGALIGMGGQLASNDMMASVGGMGLSAAQVAELQQDEYQTELQDRASDSMYARYVDPYNYKSLVGSTVLGMSSSKYKVASSLTNPFQTLASVFMPSASAAEETYDFGIKSRGLSVTERDSPLIADPYDNFNRIEPFLGEMNDKYSKCFGTKISADDSGIKLETFQVNLLEIDEDPDCNNPEANASSGQTLTATKQSSFISRLNPFASKEVYAAPPSAATASVDPDAPMTEATKLLRYQAAIADVVGAKSSVCIYADKDDLVTQEACQEIGVEPTPAINQNVDANIEPPDTINGYTLTPNEKKHLKYIAENVVSKLDGNKAKLAAESSWWSLAEGILALPAAAPNDVTPFEFSNCHFPPDRYIGYTDTCPGTLWQVGIGGVQVVYYKDLDVVEAAALKYNPGKSAEEIINQVSILSGLQEGSPLYRQAASSTGALRRSLLLRDPTTGIALVNPFMQPCLGPVTPDNSWCYRKVRPGVDDSPANIKLAIADIEKYFNDVLAGGSAGGVDIQSALNQIVGKQTGQVGISVKEIGGANRTGNAGGDKQFKTASIYKLLSSYTILKKIEAENISWNKSISAKPESDAGGGPPTLENCFNQMITYSSDTCGEYLSREFVSESKVDSDLSSLGLKNTKFTGGTNTTTANDVTLFLSKLESGELDIKQANKDKLLSLMKNQKFRDGIPAGTGQVTANKVGWLLESLDGPTLNDAGIVYLPSGTFVVSILTFNNAAKGDDARSFVNNPAVWAKINAMAADIKATMSSSGSASTTPGGPTTPGSVPSGSAQALAQKILDSSNVSYPYTDTRGLNARDVLEQVARTGKGPINSPDTTAKSVAVNPKMLQAILEYAETNKIGLNPITNADHSTNSNHYKGIAVDINCTPALNRTIFDRIAAKYGGRNNGEVCPGNAHWHYDFPL